MGIENFAEITKQLPVMDRTDIILNDDAGNDSTIEGGNILRKVGYVAKELGVPTNRVNYLLSIYWKYLDVRREDDNIDGRSRILFHADDIDKLRYINSLSKDQGLNATQIKLLLSQGKYVPEMRQDSSTLPAILTKGSEANIMLQEILEEIITNAIAKKTSSIELVEHNTEVVVSQNKQLVECLEEIKKLNERIEEKDNKIIELLEQQILEQEEKAKKKGFLGIFKKK